MSRLAAVEDADPDVEHALADPLGEQLEVDSGPDLTGAPSRFEDLGHGGVDRSRRLAGELGQLLTGVGRRVVQRQEQRGAMAHGARGNGLTEVDDPILDRPRIEVVEAVDGLLGDPIEVVLVAADELDDDRFLGLEVVVEAPGQDSRGVGDLFEGRAQA